MDVQSNETERKHDDAVIGIGEYDGVAFGRDPIDHQYGRRIEADRSWTVYHVFSGVPAHADGRAMVGLSQADATSGMLALNFYHACRRKERLGLSSSRLSVFEIARGWLCRWPF